MKLTCVSPYRTQSVAYVVGELIDVSDEEGELLLRESFAAFEKQKTRAEKVKVEAPDEVDVVADNAMSTETATGLVVPDRRARGGRKRGRGKN